MVDVSKFPQTEGVTRQSNSLPNASFTIPKKSAADVNAWRPVQSLSKEITRNLPAKQTPPPRRKMRHLRISAAC
jgi:hypothetical protein